MQWNDQENAGFTRGKPWLRVNENYTQLNVARQEDDPASLLNWYRKLACLRQEYSVLIDGDYQPLLTDDENIFAYERKNDRQAIRVFLNFSAKDLPLAEGYEKGFDVLLCSVEHQPGTIKALEALILIRNYLR